MGINNGAISAGTKLEDATAIKAILISTTLELFKSLSIVLMSNKRSSSDSCSINAHARYPEINSIVNTGIGQLKNYYRSGRFFHTRIYPCLPNFLSGIVPFCASWSAWMWEKVVDNVGSIPILSSENTPSFE